MCHRMHYAMSSCARCAKRQRTAPQSLVPRAKSSHPGGRKPAADGPRVCQIARRRAEGGNTSTCNPTGPAHTRRMPCPSARARAASPRESRRAPGPLCDARGLQGAAGLLRGGRGKGRPQRLPRCPGRALPARAQRPPLTARGPRAKGKPPKARGPSNARPPFAGARRSAPARTACDS